MNFLGNELSFKTFRKYQGIKSWYLIEDISTMHSNHKIIKTKHNISHWFKGNYLVNNFLFEKILSI